MHARLSIRFTLRSLGDKLTATLPGLWILSGSYILTFLKH